MTTTSIADRVGNLEERVDGFEERFDNIETRLEKVEDRLGKVETRLDAIETIAALLANALRITNPGVFEQAKAATERSKNLIGQIVL